MGNKSKGLNPARGPESHAETGEGVQCPSGGNKPVPGGEEGDATLVSHKVSPSSKKALLDEDCQMPEKEPWDTTSGGCDDPPGKNRG